jgi:hypothetical protein
MVSEFRINGRPLPLSFYTSCFMQYIFDSWGAEDQVPWPQFFLMHVILAQFYSEYIILRIPS